jgi:hypothetical protein
MVDRQSWTADKEWSSRLVVGMSLKAPHLESQTFCEILYKTMDLDHMEDLYVNERIILKEVLGRTNRTYPLTKHGPHRKQKNYGRHTDTQQCDLISLVTKFMGDTQQGDLISLITNFMGDTQTHSNVIS